MDEGAMDSFSREPSFIGFDNHSEASSMTYSAGESDLLDEREKDLLEELEWLDKDGNEIENVQQAWTLHHIVRTQLGQHIGCGRPPSPVLKRMLETGSTESIWPEARRWQCEKHRYLTRKGDALGEDNSAWISTHLKHPHSASLGIEGSESGSAQTDSPYLLRSSDPKDFKKAMTIPVRFCLFNMGRLDK